MIHESTSFFIQIREIAMAKKYVETPLMKQYYSIKEKHPDAILLFRVGDFYETFGEDAIQAAKVLGITLTSRANGVASSVELAGFPHHSLDTYLPRLIKGGLRVAICEQLEDPKTTKKIVKRGITELITPGVSMGDNLLNNKENNFLASIFFEKNRTGISLLDISTGEFYLAEGSISYINKLINTFNPKEILYPRDSAERYKEEINSDNYSYQMDEWVYAKSAAKERLLKQFKTSSLKGFGITEMEVGQVAAAAVLHYLDLTHHKEISHISTLARIEPDRYVWMDRFTINNLELVSSPHPEAKTLIDVLDKTLTSMGGRNIRRSILLPIKNITVINNRLSAVDNLVDNSEIRESIEPYLEEISDIERMISKIATQRIKPREVLGLKRSFEAIKPIKEILKASGNNHLTDISDRLINCEEMVSMIDKHIDPNSPVLLSKRGVIAAGVSEELDRIREISNSGKEFLGKIQDRESEATKIPSLKIGFNNVFGYYIEIRNTHKDKVPTNWIRKQTLVSAERYITEELKQYEETILGAESKISTIEQEIYNSVIIKLNKSLDDIRSSSIAIAEIDTLISYANVSIENSYCKPEVNDSLSIEIKDGRHPVIEKQLPIGEQYISNDLTLDTENQQIIMITGPNMAGKSALLRQTALIALMAQIGCFVPARSCKLGYVDKIFTRVGASDNISSGESTFMVEMNEAASILNNISDRSLILFDELGRGTSTYDGISIAWSIVEFLHSQKKNRAKTLFATHYHELNEMESSFERIKNYNVSIKEINNKIIFLRKLVRGGSNHSFGIHVAQMAGMPQSVVERANEILSQLETKKSKQTSSTSKIKPKTSPKEGYQLSIFQLDDPALMNIKEQLEAVDINNLTPIEALNKLSEIKKSIGIK